MFVVRGREDLKPQITGLNSPMIHVREELWFNTPQRRDYINITQIRSSSSSKRPACGTGCARERDAHHALPSLRDEQSNFFADSRM